MKKYTTCDGVYLHYHTDFSAPTLNEALRKKEELRIYYQYPNYPEVYLKHINGLWYACYYPDIRAAVMPKYR
jgi:hypothetical protein